jgi:hypothetical protein
VNDEHTAGGVVCHPVGNGAEQVVTYAGKTAVADDEQISILLLGDSEEGVRGLPQASG